MAQGDPLQQTRVSARGTFLGNDKPGSPVSSQHIEMLYLIELTTAARPKHQDDFTAREYILVELQ